MNIWKRSFCYWHQRSIEELRSRLRFSSDHNKFKFQNGLLYHDGHNALNGLIQLQILQDKHNVLIACNFGFNKTMEFILGNYWWPHPWKYVKIFMGSCDVCV